VLLTTECSCAAVGLHAWVELAVEFGDRGQLEVMCNSAAALSAPSSAVAPRY